MRLALASSPDDTRRSALERAEPSASRRSTLERVEAEPSATGDDDESDPEWDAAAANYDESVRRGLVVPPPKRPKHERVIGQRPRDEPALVSALKRCYALDSPGASAAYPHASHAEIVRKLRRCEQFEIALQGDDYSDKTEPHFNAEASQYAPRREAHELVLGVARRERAARGDRARGRVDDRPRRVAPAVALAVDRRDRVKRLARGARERHRERRRSQGGGGR